MMSDYENDCDYGDYLYDTMREKELDDALNRKAGAKMVERGVDGKAVWYTWSAEEMLWIED